MRPVRRTESQPLCVGANTQAQPLLMMGLGVPEETLSMIVFVSSFMLLLIILIL